jgi:iron(III) transport system substrate-binding protein
LKNNPSRISLVGLLALLFCLVTANAQADWKTDWDKIVQAAEKEGQVTVYIGGYGAVIDAGIFQKAYPKIKVVSVTGSGTDLTGRIATERRAGKYLPDVYSSGGNSLYQILYTGKMLDPIKPALVLPEVTDPSKWFESKHKYVDKEGQHIFVYEANVSNGGGASYNTQLLNPQEFKSYWDFVNPKLKGRIVSIDIRKVRGAGIPWQFLYYHPALGPKYIRRLFTEMEPTMTADLRQAVDWLATGKFSLCIPTQGSGITKAQNQGLPVNSFDPYHFKEGVNLSSAFGSIALMNRAPHPNAAKVFINWYLSREGQALFQKTISIPGDPKNSRRVDVPKDHIPPEEQRRDKMNYFDTDDPETKDLTPAMKLLDEILAGKK